MAFGVRTNTGATTKVRTTHPTSSMTAPPSSRGTSDALIDVKSTDQDSTAHVTQDNGNAATPKKAAEATSAVRAHRAPMGARIRCTSVPLYRSKPTMPAAQVVVVHMPMTPPRTPNIPNTTE